MQDVGPRRKRLARRRRRRRRKKNLHYQKILSPAVLLWCNTYLSFLRKHTHTHKKRYGKWGALVWIELQVRIKAEGDSISALKSCGLFKGNIELINLMSAQLKAYENRRRSNPKVVWVHRHITQFHPQLKKWNLDGLGSRTAEPPPHKRSQGITEAISFLDRVLFQRS